jgi:hypothetical protein
MRIVDVTSVPSAAIGSAADAHLTRNGYIVYNRSVYVIMHQGTASQKGERPMEGVDQQILRLLGEMKDLLVPISDEYRAAYERRQSIRALIADVINTPERARMYELMNGSRTQVEIAERAGVTQGAVSRFMNTAKENDLVQMVRVGAAERPARKYNIRTARRIGEEER